MAACLWKEIRRNCNAFYHGLTRTLIDNMIKGVTTGFEKKLEISGVGYRAESSDKSLKVCFRFLQSGTI